MFYYHCIWNLNHVAQSNRLISIRQQLLRDRESESEQHS